MIPAPEVGSQRVLPDGRSLTVISLAKHSETEELVVLFTTGVGLYWVQGLSSFNFQPEAPTSPEGEFSIELGWHQHYKGTHYEVVCRARDVQTQQLLLVYQAEEGHRWVRPEAMFVDEVTWPDGTIGTRFRYVARWLSRG